MPINKLTTYYWGKRMFFKNEKGKKQAWISMAVYFVDGKIRDTGCFWSVKDALEYRESIGNVKGKDKWILIENVVKSIPYVVYDEDRDEEII